MADESAPIARNSNVVQNVQNSDTTLVLMGSDGKTRTTKEVDQPGVQGRKVELAKNDSLHLSDDGKVADIINGNGEVVGSFTAPRLFDENGSELSARFFVYDDILILAQEGIANRDACTKATVGKWTYRVGAAGVCGALGAGTGGLAGGACGLGASLAEDHIDFDKVC